MQKRSNKSYRDTCTCTTKHLITGPKEKREFCFKVEGLRETKLTVSLWSTH